LVCVDRVTEPIGTRGRNPANVVDATRGVALGESFGVATVALETFEVAVGSVLVRLLEIRGDSSMNERCVDLLERPERMPETVHQHLTPLGQTNCWRTYPESRLPTAQRIRVSIRVGLQQTLDIIQPIGSVPASEPPRVLTMALEPFSIAIRNVFACPLKVAGDHHIRRRFTHDSKRLKRLSQASRVCLAELCRDEVGRCNSALYPVHLSSRSSRANKLLVDVTETGLRNRIQDPFANVSIFSSSDPTWKSKYECCSGAVARAECRRKPAERARDDRGGARQCAPAGRRLGRTRAFGAREATEQKKPTVGECRYSESSSE
jgi:hypothetical protein